MRWESHANAREIKNIANSKILVANSTLIPSNPIGKVDFINANEKCLYIIQWVPLQQANIPDANYTHTVCNWLVFNLAAERAAQNE